MNEIVYDFGRNGQSIEAMHGHINNVAELRDSVSKVFQVLNSVYEGEGQLRLNEAAQKVDSMLSEIGNNVTHGLQQAQDQQDAMAAMDRANAAQF